MNNEFTTHLLEIISQQTTSKINNLQNSNSDSCTNSGNVHELDWNEISSLLTKKGYQGVSPEICLKIWFELAYNLNNSTLEISPQCEQEFISYHTVPPQEVYQYLTPTQIIERKKDLPTPPPTPPPLQSSDKTYICCICKKTLPSHAAIHSHLQKTHSGLQLHAHAKEIEAYNFAKPPRSQIVFKELQPRPPIPPRPMPSSIPSIVTPSSGFMRPGYPGTAMNAVAGGGGGVGVGGATRPPFPRPVHPRPTVQGQRPPVPYTLSYQISQQYPRHLYPRPVVPQQQQQQQQQPPQPGQSAFRHPNILQGRPPTQQQHPPQQLQQQQLSNNLSNTK